VKEIIFVGVGGFIGATLRYMISSWSIKFSQYGFPLGTFLVNIIGCIMIGIVIGINFDKNINIIPVKEFLIIGILGGFTTFSAFGLESFEMLKTGQLKMAVLYIFASVVIGLLGVSIGTIISK
tara:strand:- start:923 stop:1291 length:369 start_codon:yes stop_codon:yes gene_type:complete